MRIKAFLAGGFLALALFGVAAAGPLEDARTAEQRGDYATEMALLRPLTDQGNAVAEIDLGLMYEHGQGVPQDFAQAVIWYRKAANQENAAARYNLGVMCENGQGVPQDYVRAHMWFNLAASGASDNRTREEAVKAVARPVYQIPILLTAIRAIFANQRYTDLSKGASLRRCVSRHGKGQV